MCQSTMCPLSPLRVLSHSPTFELVTWNDKHAWTSSTPGAQIRMSFRGTQVGLFIYASNGRSSNETSSDLAVRRVEAPGQALCWIEEPDMSEEEWAAKYGGDVEDPKDAPAAAQSWIVDTYAPNKAAPQPEFMEVAQGLDPGEQCVRQVPPRLSWLHRLTQTVCGMQRPRLRSVEGYKERWDQVADHGRRQPVNPDAARSVVLNHQWMLQEQSRFERRDCRELLETCLQLHGSLCVSSLIVTKPPALILQSLEDVVLDPLPPLLKVALDARRNRRHRLPADVPQLGPTRQDLLHARRDKRVGPRVRRLVLRPDERPGRLAEGVERGREGGVREGRDFLLRTACASEVRFEAGMGRRERREGPRGG